MNEISAQMVTPANFNVHSLDDFVRHQVVTECRRNVSGEWKLLPIGFTEEWSIEKCRAEACEILDRINELTAFIALHDGTVAGYITVGHTLMGSRGQYAQLEAFQVSEPFRGRGIGRRLFQAACKAARDMGAESLYISAHSSRESQAAYRALGCVHAREIIHEIAALEPCDVQMEYVLE